jgi:predicted amidophosphoribosyltransferase
MTQKHKVPDRNAVVGAWSGFITTTIVFLLLGRFLFSWAWWIYIPIVGSLIGAINSTCAYVGREKIYCPKCHAPITEDAEFCNKCGTKLLTICPSCQAKIKPESHFCVKCGASLLPKDTEVLPSIPPPQTQPASPATQIPKANPNEYCPACGTKIQPGAKFCAFCGSNL